MRCVAFIISVAGIHFFVSQSKNSNFFLRPEILINDFLKRVALGTRMDPEWVY